MDVAIRPMTEADRMTAKRICHAAFGTFLGAPDPENFWMDRDYVYGRFGAEHVAGFVAKADGEVVGSNFATRWGSVGFFGPLTIRPDLWNSGLGQRPSAPPAIPLPHGASATPVFSLSRTAPSTSGPTASSAFIPAS